MRALVIGGNRFFGKQLVSILLDQGVKVTLLNRGQRSDYFGTKVERICLDRSLLRKNHPDLGNNEWDIIYDQVCYNAKDALSACETFQNRTKKYIFTSSQSVYNTGAGLTESVFDPKSYSFDNYADQNTDYSEAKRQAEAIFFQKANFPVAAVRFPIVLGEDDYSERLKFHVDHILEDKPIYFPNINAKISFIHAKDAAAFLNFLFSHDISGPINCCSTEPISLKDLIKIIETKTGHLAKISNSENDDNSPFGIGADWFMDTSKIISYGYKIRPILEWLPTLIK